MIIKIPNELKQIVQANNSDAYLSSRQGVLNNIWSSFNMNFNGEVKRKGRVTNTRTILVQQGSTVATNPFAGVPVGFRLAAGGNTTPNRIYTIAGSRVYYNGGLPSSNFTYDAATNTRTDYDSTRSDIELFTDSSLGLTLVTTTGGPGAVWYYTNGTPGIWTKSGSDFNTNSPHMLTSYATRLYAVDGKIITSCSALGSSWVTSGTAQYSLTIPSNYVVTFLRSAASRIWIGLLDVNGGKGYVYSWDGSAVQITTAYRLQAHGALACVIKDDIPYVMDSEGRLLAWNGGTFQEIARLPVSYKLLWLPYSMTNNRFIHPNGMTVVNGKINILVINNNYDNATMTSTSIEENLPSGIWEYDEAIGLYHKFSLSYTGTATTTVTDYGQNRLLAAGGLSDEKIDSTTSTTNGFILAGAGYYTDATTTDYGIWTNDTLNTTQKYGYFVTPKIESENITESWSKAYVTYRKLLNTSDKIVVKYRIIEIDSTDINITWVNTTSFTTTTDLVSLGYGIGSEIEVTQGTGSGLCSHIVSITGSGTFTVTVDETYTGVTTGTAKARVQAWTKVLNPITNQTAQWQDLFITNDSPWIQIKVCMLFTGKNEINTLTLVTTPQVQAKT